jgi:polar amino acid transport system substrate-binding protein
MMPRGPHRRSSRSNRWSPPPALAAPAGVVDHRRVTRRWWVLVLAGAVLGGCGVTIPTDPDGTLDRVRDGVLRVGVSVDPPWTELGRSDAQAPTGIEPDLVAAFAASLDADVDWTTGGEASLIRELESGKLDVVVGGLTAESPWTDHAALTRPYVTVSGPGGEPEPHVMAVVMGENAFLVELERYLSTQDVPETVP